MPTRPVPQPASSTRPPGASRPLTYAASPCTSEPEAASSSKAASYDGPRSPPVSCSQRLMPARLGEFTLPKHVGQDCHARETRTTLRGRTARPVSRSVPTTEEKHGTPTDRRRQHRVRDG